MIDEKKAQQVRYTVDNQKPKVVLEFLQRQPIAQIENEEFYNVFIIRNNILYAVKLHKDFSDVIPALSFFQFQEQTVQQDD